MSHRKEIYTVRWEGEEGRVCDLPAKKDANLLDLFREHHIAAEASCNGSGICGKCGVIITQGEVPVTEEQRAVFTKQQLLEGCRLACQVKVTGNLTAKPLAHRNNPQEAFNVSAARIHTPQIHTSQIHTPQIQASRIQCGSSRHSGSTGLAAASFAIAADLGSTTLAAVLVDASGRIAAQTVGVNSQRSYGADVISRMKASNDGKRRELQSCICRDLEQMFFVLVQKMRQKQNAPVHVSRIALAGNTVMLHLLRGYSCETLASYPFLPVSLELECFKYEELFSDVEGCTGSSVFLLPGISAFVGADITAGLYSSGFWQTPENEQSFLIDLGTNGELAFGNRAGYVTASAAAGPAFEGGQLSCGTAGIPGAICGVSYLFHRVRVQTIGQKKPCGLCGTGALEAVAALLQEGLLDQNGLLAPQLFEKGMLLAKREDGSGIYLTQADIREIQMAKAAIRAGIEVLIRRYAGLYQKRCKKGFQMRVSRVYLAGGFGYYLSADTAAAVGLFPSEWKERIVLCGNTSLKGAAAFLTDAACRDTLKQIRGKNTSIRLESDSSFQDEYISRMQFLQD